MTYPTHFGATIIQRKAAALSAWRYVTCPDCKSTHTTRAQTDLCPACRKVRRKRT